MSDLFQKESSNLRALFTSFGLGSHYLWLGMEADCILLLTIFLNLSPLLILVFII